MGISASLTASVHEDNGCIDFSPYFSAHVAFQWRQFIGGEEDIQNYCNDLARRGDELLAQKMGMHVLDLYGEFTLAMVNITLPFPREMAEKYDAAVGAVLSNRQLSRNMYAVTYHHHKHWWTRASDQIWNELCSLLLHNICNLTPLPFPTFLPLSPVRRFQHPWKCLCFHLQRNHRGAQ
ncbi:hypothetical protein GYMLUDRAFT_43133 [Collybiopsis luxurians FD-317 M1]|uniref:Uncharacterized protein n=1 Tax=Collybiopsis luxurians FD-317 M1 TaxID=944289 RepID=A0A0D0CEQ7_9AGAR|nr:hypothetical protein GYMLUDRAFT_43133 [Collybiopsis luxurians FD-317 M1]